MGYRETAGMWFDEQGSLNISESPSLSQFLSALSEQIAGFRSSLTTCVRSAGGGHLLRDKNAGTLRGMQVRWNQVTQLSMAAITMMCRDSLDQLQEQCQESEHGVFTGALIVPLNLQPIKDVLSQITFLLPYDQNGQWVSEVDDETAAKLAVLHDQVNRHMQTVHEFEQLALARQQAVLRPTLQELTRARGEAFSFAARDERVYPGVIIAAITSFGLAPVPDTTIDGENVHMLGVALWGCLPEDTPGCVSIDGEVPRRVAPIISAWNQKPRFKVPRLDAFVIRADALRAALAGESAPSAQGPLSAAQFRAALEEIARLTRAAAAEIIKTAPADAIAARRALAATISEPMTPATLGETIKELIASAHLWLPSIEDISTPIVPAKPQPPAARAEFRRDGKFYHIDFAGQTKVVRTVLGFRILEEVLSRPNTTRPPTAIELMRMARLNAETQSFQEANDGQSIEEQREQAESLKRELEQARQDGDEPREHRILAEIKELTDQAQRDRGLGKRQRAIGPRDPAASATASIASARKRALEELQSEPPHTALIEHLEEFVYQEGGTLVYRPTEPAPNWIFGNRQE